jgi:DNA gyrase subunit B
VGSATIIAVVINTKDHIYSVLDNGRGLPISDDVPITVSTKLHSGAKFQDKKTAYTISSGMHGVGLVAVNALSSEYRIEVYRNKKHAIFEFKDTKFKGKKINSFTESPPFSTKIEFKPDKKIFESLLPDIDRIRRRLTVASAQLPEGYTFVLNIDGKREIFRLTIDEYFSEQCNLKEHTPIVKLESSQNPEIFNVIFSYELQGTISPKILSSINLLPVDGGGTHVNIFYDMFREFFMSKAKKYGFSFLANDCLSGLRAYLILDLIKPSFSGQVKEKLEVRKTYLQPFIKQLSTQLESYYSKHEDELKLLLEKFAEYRNKLDSNKVKANTNGKRATTKFTKLRDCKSRNGELFVVEGESAGGPILQCRNPNIHAVFPLKGKILNISKNDASQIVKNKEMSELLSAFGTGFGANFDISKLRYDKIICATDADPDGGHIASLITMAIAILTPEIIRQGKYFIAQTPLYAISEKKEFIPLWDKESLDEAIAKNRNIQRYKGLGEMNPDQMKISLIDEATRRLIPITFTEKIQWYIDLFSTSEEKRKLLDV